MFKKINESLSLNSNDTFFFGLFIKFPLGVFFQLLSILTVFPYTYYYEVKHYLLYSSNKSEHKEIGWKSELKSDGLLHTWYEDKCSCGRRAPGKDVVTAIEKSLHQTFRNI